MDKYRKVAKSAETPVNDETEIRCTTFVTNGVYLSRVATLFGEMKKSYVTITGTGRALTKAVHLAELIKRRFKGLHQITHVGTTEIVDDYEPLEEGLDRVTDTRLVSHVEIKLSKELLDTSDKGYQPPLDESEVREYEVEELPRGRGPGRSGRSVKGKGTRSRKGSDGTTTSDAEEDAPKTKGRGKGNGKGKGKDKSVRADTNGGTTTVTTDGGDQHRSKGKGTTKKQGDTTGKKAGFPREEAEPTAWGKTKGKGKGKSKTNEGLVEDEPKGKGKAKGKKAGFQSAQFEEARGKGKGKSRGYGNEWRGYEEDMFRGSGKSESKGNYGETYAKKIGKDKESAKPWSSWDDGWDSYPSAGGKATNRSNPSNDDWGYRYESPATGDGAGSGGTATIKSKSKGKSKGKSKSRGKGEAH
eukprot:TRINITY_DN849_c0_g1_i13.p1 TRINITY_DN849_c0_g1~~TRINITY_DN849_c0_g1_i13.p1  ORF type:complete len:414 (-),score=71.40 TRINITY_DN849_c0_g1_i13:731-1972(-)